MRWYNASGLHGLNARVMDAIIYCTRFKLIKCARHRCDDIRDYPWSARDAGRLPGIGMPAADDQHQLSVCSIVVVRRLAFLWWWGLELPTVPVWLWPRCSFASCSSQATMCCPIHIGVAARCWKGSLDQECWAPSPLPLFVANFFFFFFVWTRNTFRSWSSDHASWIFVCFSGLARSNVPWFNLDMQTTIFVITRKYQNNNIWYWLCDHGAKPV